MIQQCEQVLTIGILSVVLSLLGILLYVVLSVMKRKSSPTKDTPKHLPPVNGMPRAVYSCGKHIALVRVGQMAVFNDQKCFFCNTVPENA